MEDFSIRLKKLRITKSLSIKALAKEIGVRSKTLGWWERNLSSPKITHLYKIAKVFNVSANYLIGLET